MSRAFSYSAMICGFISSILFAILAALYRAGNTHLYLCIAVTCMAFIFVRFNLGALRNDKTDRLFVVNNGAVLVLFVSVAYFIRVFMGGFPTWLDITIGAVAGVYAIVIIIFYVLNARKGNLRRL